MGGCKQLLVYSYSILSFISLFPLFPLKKSDILLHTLKCLFLWILVGQLTTKNWIPLLFHYSATLYMYTTLHYTSFHFSNHTGVHQSHLHSNLRDGGRPGCDRLHLHPPPQGLPPQRLDHSGPGSNPLWVSKTRSPTTHSQLHARNANFLPYYLVRLRTSNEFYMI